MRGEPDQLQRDDTAAHGGGRVRTAVLVALLALLAVKVLFAARVDLFWDEAFYWQCGQRPAIAYADHPPVTAMLVRVGTEIVGDTPLGVRSLFLCIGALFPFAVYALAQPLVGRRDAWLAAGATLVMFATASLGLLAVPDAVLMLAAVLFLVGFERATREGDLGAWMLVGAAGCLGLATHYRFVLVPFAALVYLVATRNGRRQWRQGGLWLAAGLLLVGLLPTIIYNLGNDFASLRYHLAGRHGVRFRAGALGEFVAGQAVIVSPFLLVGLLGVLVDLIRRARTGDDRAALFAVFALTHLGLFLLASPFESRGLFTLHWPVPGYVPLLVYLPSMLRRLLRGAGRWLRALVVVLVPGVGAVVVALLFVELGTGWLGLGDVREPFIGWSQAAKRAKAYLTELGEPGRRAIVVGDNYCLAANLEFHLHSLADVYTLDHPRNHKHGRAPQFDAWGTSEAGLRARAGENALVVVEWSEVSSSRRDEWMAHIGSLFDRLEPLGELRVAHVGTQKAFKEYRFYRGIAIRPEQDP